MCYNKFLVGTTLAVVMSTGSALALPASVTPEIIFGSGNANGDFTIKTVNFPSTTNPGSVELGLRAKLRYDDAGSPQNIFNWDGNHTYNFKPTAGTPSNRSVFNFEWSAWSDGLGTIEQINSTDAGLRISYDIDPADGVDFVEYDPLAFDAYYGTLTTANGGGVYDSTGTAPAGAVVAQNSVNYGFLPGAPLGPGSYDIRLSVLNFGGSVRDFTEIKVNVVPVPAALPMLGGVFVALGVVGWRKRRQLPA